MRRYFEVLEALGLGPFWADFLRTNPARDAPYHNLWHAQQVVEDCDDGARAEGIDAPGELRALILGAMYHDWGHLGGDAAAVGRWPGGRIPDSENIQRALEHVRNVHRLRAAAGTWPADAPIEAVAAVIQATEFPHREMSLTRSQAIIRDADWMAAFRETFVPHVIGGLAAECRVPMLDSLASRLAAMERFEPFTAWGREVFRRALPAAKAEVAFLVRQLGA